MIRKKPIKNSDKVSVVFEMDGLDTAGSVEVVGDFNAWKPGKNPMKKRKDGAWSTAIRLPRDGRFEYRFLVDGKEWMPDEQADSLVPNPFGGRNSVVAL